MNPVVVRLGVAVRPPGSVLTPGRAADRHARAGSHPAPVAAAVGASWPEAVYGARLERGHGGRVEGRRCGFRLTTHAGAAAAEAPRPACGKQSTMGGEG